MDDAPVEILVHIAAPSRTADDVRYRALASAYTAFQPATRRPVHGLNESGCEPPVLSSTSYPSIFRRGKAASPALDERLESLQDREGPPCSLNSPQASFGSVLDNAGSPSVVRAYRVPSSAPQEDSWQSPSSLVGDSQPEVSTAVADLTSPTRLLEYYLQGFDSFTSSSWSPSLRQGTVAGGEELGADASQSSDHRAAPAKPIASIPALAGVVPSSVPYDDSHESSMFISELKSVTAATIKPLHPTATAKELEPRASNLRGAVQTDLHVSFVPSTGPIALGRSDSEPSAIPKSSLSTTRALHQALSRASSDLGPRSSVLHAVTSSSTSTADFSAVSLFSSHGYTLDSLELCAPEPPVASDTILPSDLITPQLRDLLEDAQPRRRKSQPKTQTREIRPTERGYWDVDCMSWSPELKRATWAHLANWIGMGLAGWGTRCTRDEEFTRVRLYCWGETAPYLYYLLWLTSYRKILAAECAWVDADGKAVLVMGMC